MDRGAVSLRVYVDPWDVDLRRNRLFGGPLSDEGKDHTLAPWIYLRKACLDAGIELMTADYMPAEQSGRLRHLYYSFGRLSNVAQISQRDDVIPAAIYLFEPPIGVSVTKDDPYHQLGNLTHVFRRVFTTSPPEAIRRFVRDVPAGIVLHPFCYPQPFNTVIEKLWSNDARKFLVMINSYNQSPHRQMEFYSERVRALRYFGRRREIDLYGYRWDPIVNRQRRDWLRLLLRHSVHTDFTGLHRELELWRAAGALERALHSGCRGEKHKTMAQYRFAICFESMGIDGFVTEKIFDCFFAGTIPVYLGAPDITDYIPAECFIDMRYFDSYSHLYRYLKSLSRDACELMRAAARDFITSSGYQRFSKEAFAQQFVDDVFANLSSHA